MNIFIIGSNTLDHSLVDYIISGNYSCIFREPIDLSTGFAWHRVRKELYALGGVNLHFLAHDHKEADLPD